ncbi:MAG: hypothetical protein J0G30_12855 [Actinomycetales bacterium]|nr:hypothetical protein [Actinomycetales bacterium]
MDLLDRPAPAPLTAPPGLRLVPLRAGRWRVTRSDGSVLGYLEHGGPAGSAARAGDPRAPYRSLRLAGGPDPRLVPVGEFWRPDDALESLR